MGSKAWELARDEFIALWNASASLEEAAAHVRARVGPPVPQWAVMARAGELRGDGYELQRLTPPPPRPLS